MSVFLNKFITFLTSRLMYVNIINFFVLFVFYLLFLRCDLFVLLLAISFFFVMDYVYGESIFLGYVEEVFSFMLFCLFCDG